MPRYSDLNEDSEQYHLQGLVASVVVFAAREVLQKGVAVNHGYDAEESDVPSMLIAKMS